MSNSRNRAANISEPAIATIVSLLLVATVAPWYIAAIQAPSFAFIWLQHFRTQRLLRKRRDDLNRSRRELDEMAEMQGESGMILALMRAELMSAEATYESHRIDIYDLPSREPNNAALLLEMEEHYASLSSEEAGVDRLKLEVDSIEEVHSRNSSRILALEETVNDEIARIGQSRLFSSLPEAFRDGREPRLFLGALIITIAVDLIFSVAGPFWLPKENIAVEGSAKPIPGYVIKADGMWTTILDSRNDAIVRVKSDQVTSRENCHGSATLGSRTVAMLVFATNPSEPPALCVK